jgi:hypothetical protein
MDELIQMVAQRADISTAKAALAVTTMLSYLTVRLPSPVIGRIREQLTDAKRAGDTNADGGAK